MFENPPEEWFSNWFDSPYYHTLYKNRDTNEARLFIDNLLRHIQLPVQARIADIACGKGRHSIYLNKKGFDVTGIDISAHSIQYAKKFENETLHFAIHDMRKPFISDYFDAALNLFTSLGYFKTAYENELAIKTMYLTLKKNGIVVIDFFNANTVLQNSLKKEEKCIDGIVFQIKKRVVGKTLVKDIEFTAGGKDFHFTEEVQMLSLKDFEKQFKSVGLIISQLFGDYSLNAYDPERSDRLIIIGTKH